MKFESRKYVIITFFLLIGISYAVKLFYMQVIDDTWKLRAQQIAEKKREIAPPRAVVFDRNGKKIISNMTYYNLMMVEDDIHDLDTVAFAKLLGWTVQQVRDRFKEVIKEQGTFYNKHKRKRETNYRPNRPYPFVKEYTAEEMALILPHLEKYPGFFEEVASMRHYPYSSGANILGYLAEVTQREIDEDKFYRPGHKIGRSGIERFYEKEFRGVKGIKYIVTSAGNDEVGSFANGKYDTLAVQAEPIHLGVDILLQQYGEQLMQNKKGCIVAIEPATGEILAMISAPSYDPNLLIGNKKISENYPKLEQDPDLPLFPRPLKSQYMPGSTFKLVQSLIGLQEGVITETSSFPCNKSLVGCHNHPTARSVTDAVQMSCNPYFYAVTRRIIHQGKNKSLPQDAAIGLNIWAEYMNSFGLGIKLGVDIPGVLPGLIPTSDYYDYEFPSKKHPYGKNGWQFSTIRSISIGQGEVQITPLQLANLAAIMANRGWYYTPHFVKSIGDGGPLPQYRVKNYTKVEAKYFAPVVEGMRRVVQESGGTARMARIDGITICGKTGTVENYIGSEKQKNHSVFIAFAPMDDPKIAIAVFIENAGGGGGTWAAPLASLMIEKYLKGSVADTLKEERIMNAILIEE